MLFTLRIANDLNIRYELSTWILVCPFKILLGFQQLTHDRPLFRLRMLSTVLGQSSRSLLPKNGLCRRFHMPRRDLRDRLGLPGDDLVFHLPGIVWAVLFGNGVWGFSRHLSRLILSTDSCGVQTDHDGLRRRRTGYGDHGL